MVIRESMETKYEEVSAIMTEALKCKTYRKLEHEQLHGIDYKYSIGSEAVEVLEEADATGRQLEKYCTNNKEVEEHDAKTAEIVQEHVLTCQEKGCSMLREYRHKLNVSGY